MGRIGRRKAAARRERAATDGTRRAASTAIPASISVPLAVAAVMAVGVANTGAIANPDYGFHLRFGEEIVRQLAPPRSDHHSFTAPGARYLDHEWLTQAMFHVARRAVGDGGMVALQGLLVALTAAALLVALRRPLPLALAAVAVVTLLGLPHSQMRPHLLSWLLAALLVWLLRARAYWALPLLFLLWANLHGSVLLGVGIAGLRLLEELFETGDRRLAGWAAAVAAVPLLNPYGLHAYSLFFEISDHTSFIGEWKPYGPETGAFWLLVAIFGLAILGLRWRKRSLPFDLVRIGVLGWLAFGSSRNGIMAAIFVCPMLHDRLGPRVAGWSRRTQILAAALLAALLVGVAGSRVKTGQALRFEVDHLQLPVESVRFVRESELRGPVFNDYNFGGYLLWKAWPTLPVFVDGRTEVYKGTPLQDYLRVSRAEPGWEDVVERYGVTFFLIRPERAIARVLLEDKGWDLVYFDYNSVVYVRRGLFPELRRLRVISPYGDRDRTKARLALSEISYLTDRNPQFYGGYKVKAFLHARVGEHELARDALRRYLALHPEGAALDDTRQLIGALGGRGLWP